MRKRLVCFLFLSSVVIALSGCGVEGVATPVVEPAVSPVQSPSSEPTSAPVEESRGISSVRSSETPKTPADPAMDVPSDVPAGVPPDTSAFASELVSSAKLSLSLVERYQTAIPHKWGENIPGVRTHLVTQDKVIALTFDACGGKEGSGYDEKLIDYLIKEQIPATLFVNARWLSANPDMFAKLAGNPLFEIENHGTEHRPLSVNGRAAYGIAGTKDVSDAIREVTGNADEIEKLTGRRPLFFRSGTAFYDDIAVDIAHDLGFQLAGYNVLGDAGATFNTEQVYNALTKARSGSIVLAHMNHPEKDTAEGVMKAIPVMQKAGFRFVLLSDYPVE
jgi:peptidoglycan/xylan/chitin deacetylase (PgdA/CDA1 family)